MASLVSVNVSLPVTVETGGGPVVTGIFKKPVEGKVNLAGYNLAGDRQADLTVHGGPYKAVYGYASEHYDFWREQFPDKEMPWGMFGENLTTEGLLEGDLRIGDRLRIGTTLLQVSQPRMPCYKLALKFNRSDMVKRFWASGRAGFYFSVVEEGELQKGDAIVREAEGAPAISISEVVSLYRNRTPAREAMERAIASPLAPSWKEEFRERLAMAR
ncbi:MAG: MOSC domain-containing protein [Bryobacteraceae bacterium]